MGSQLKGGEGISNMKETRWLGISMIFSTNGLDGMGREGMNEWRWLFGPGLGFVISLRMRYPR